MANSSSGLEQESRSRSTRRSSPATGSTASKTTTDTRTPGTTSTAERKRDDQLLRNKHGGRLRRFGDGAVPGRQVTLRRRKGYAEGACRRASPGDPGRRARHYPQ